MTGQSILKNPKEKLRQLGGVGNHENWQIASYPFSSLPHTKNSLPKKIIIIIMSSGRAFGLLEHPFLPNNPPPPPFFFSVFFWPRLVFTALRRLSLVAVSGGYSLLQCTGFSLPLLLWSMGSRCAD